MASGITPADCRSTIPASIAVQVDGAYLSLLNGSMKQGRFPNETGLDRPHNATGKLVHLKFAKDLTVVSRSEIPPCGQGNTFAEAADRAVHQKGLNHIPGVITAGRHCGKR